MEMKHSLNLSLRPALIMTPRLQQALKLLQVPTIELQQILKQEIMQNPLLEEVDEVTDSEDLAKEDSPEEAANEEAEDPAEEDPIGVGARDLRECLLIQLEARDAQGTLAWKLVHDQFDSLVNRRFPEIARQLKCSAEEVQAAADVVATLNPKPGFQVSSEDPKYVVPDLIVERVDDQYVVLLNDRHLPRLRISAAYESVLRDKKRAECTDGEAKTREYIQSKLNSARWLIQTIEQRRRTMIKVMNCIIREQREFFDKGIAFLRPLTLQQVARQIDMHESTVSRVCSGKYVQTPRGVFELKFYFSSGLETEDGEDVSARTAKDIIKTLIEEEDRKEPLSDQRIAELLHEKGLRIARRTVAKYREQLSILPARFRRRVA